MDEAFQPYIDSADKLLGHIERNLKHAEELEHIFKYRLTDTVSITDIKLIASFIVLLQYQQLSMMRLLHTTVGALEEVGFHTKYIPIELMWELSEILPKFGLPLKDRLDTIEKELNRIKKRREKVRLEVPEDVKKVIEYIAKQVEESKRAQSKYVR